MGTMQRILLALGPALLLVACAAHKPAAPALAIKPSPAAVEIPLEQVLAQVKAAAVPAGITPSLYAELKSELVRVLRERAAARAASATPSFMRDQIRDLVLDHGGTGGYELRWTYSNSGDYDLNGEVSISDLTPIGLYFGATTESANWAQARRADGDGNGEINISDITAIGGNYLATVRTYQIWATTALNSEWVELGSFGLENLDASGALPQMTAYLLRMDYTFYRVWPSDGSSKEGDWSNIAWLGNPQERKLIRFDKVF